MKIPSQLDQWKEDGVLSTEQHTLLVGLVKGDSFSLFLELNVLLYAGVLAFAAGLGWTISTWPHQLGDVFVLAILSAIFGLCLWYCFSRASVWSTNATASPNLLFDYVLYLGALVWSIELTYLESRFHVLSGAGNTFLLATAALFLFLAYRFDNRLVLSLAFTSLAGWFGIAISHWPGHQDAAYRQSAMLYSLILICAGILFKRSGWKPHFFNTYINVAANVLFWALLAELFEGKDKVLWFLAVVVACAASLGWGLPRRQFSFVAYAAIYGYIAVTWAIFQTILDASDLLFYFPLSCAIMLYILFRTAQRFGGENERIQG